MTHTTSSERSPTAAAAPWRRIAAYFVDYFVRRPASWGAWPVWMGTLVIRHHTVTRQSMRQSGIRDLGADAAGRAVLRLVGIVSMASNCWEASVESDGCGQQRRACHLQTDGNSVSCQISALGVFPHDLLALGRLSNEPSAANHLPDRGPDYWLDRNWLVCCQPIRWLSSHTLRPGCENDCRRETEDAYRMVRRLAREEGLLVGLSSGANVVGTLSGSGGMPPETIAPLTSNEVVKLG